jgi:hypothetical protein
MKSFAAAALRRAASNGATGDSSAAAIDVDIDTDSDDEDYIQDTSDDVSDDEEEDTRRAVAEEDQEREENQEKEDTQEEEKEPEEEEEQEAEEEQEDDNADDDGFNSSNTNVYLGQAGIGCPGSLAYRGTVQRLTKKEGFYWSDKFFKHLLKKHRPNSFRILDAGNSRWRKASSNEIRSAAKNTLGTYRAKHRAGTRAARGGGSNKRKKCPKAASRQCSDDEDKVTDDDAKFDYDVYESDQDKKPSATKQKAADVQKDKKRSRVAKKARTSSTHNKKKPAHKPPTADALFDTLLSQLLARITAFNSEDVNACEKGVHIKEMITLIENGRAKLDL